MPYEFVLRNIFYRPSNVHWRGISLQKLCSAQGKAKSYAVGHLTPHAGPARLRNHAPRLPASWPFRRFPEATIVVVLADPDATWYRSADSAEFWKVMRFSD